MSKIGVARIFEKCLRSIAKVSNANIFENLQKFGNLPKLILINFSNSQKISVSLVTEFNSLG